MQQLGGKHHHPNVGGGEFVFRDGAPSVESSGRDTMPKEKPPRLVHQAGALIGPEGIIAAAVKTRNRDLSAKTCMVFPGPGLPVAGHSHAFGGLMAYRKAVAILKAPCISA
jgi:hypothetical protein